MIDPARIRETAQRLRAEAEALEAMLAAGAANDRPEPVRPPEAAPRPALRVIPAPPSPNGGLTDPAAFFAALRASDEVFGGRLTEEQVAGIEALLKIGAGRLPLAWMAYVLGTAYHETGHRMVAIREKGNGDRDGDGVDDWFEQYDVGQKAIRLGNTPEADGDGALYCGRGPVQITGKANYAKATKRLQALDILRPDEDLTKTPDLALDLIVGAAICVFGMLEGWFTGLKLNDFINATAPGQKALDQFTKARPIVNGTDRAALIAKYALAFMRALVAGGWR